MFPVSLSVGRDWSSREMRLLAFAGGTPEEQNAAKVPEVQKVPVLSLYGENPQDVFNHLMQSPQLMQATAEANKQWDQVKQMEQCMFSHFVGGKSPKEIEDYVTRRNAHLKGQNAPWSISRESDFISIHPRKNPAQEAQRIERRRRFLTDTIREKKSMIAALSKMSHGRNMIIAGRILKIEKEINSIQREIDYLVPTAQPASAPSAPQSPGIPRPDDPRFAKQGEQMRFDLNERLQRIQPPEAAKQIQTLPQQLQGPVVRVYETLPIGAQQMLMGVMQGFTALPQGVQQSVCGVLLGTAQGGPSPEAEQFLQTLTPEQRNVLDRIGNESRLSYEQGAPLTERARRTITSLINRYRTAKNEYERSMAEGTMRMMGVDIESTNFDPSNIQMHPKDSMERLFGILMGLLQIVSALGDSTSLKGKDVKAIKQTKDKAAEAATKEKTQEEFLKEKKSLETQISLSNGTEKGLQKNIDELKESMRRDAGDSEKTEAYQLKLAELETKLKELVTARKVLEKKLEDLKKKEEEESRWNVIGKKKSEEKKSGEAQKEENGPPTFQEEKNPKTFESFDTSAFKKLPFEAQMNIVTTMTEYTDTTPTFNTAMVDIVKSVNTLIQKCILVVRGLDKNNLSALKKTSEDLSKIFTETDNSIAVNLLMSQAEQAPIPQKQRDQFYRIIHRRQILSFFKIAVGRRVEELQKTSAK